MTKSATRQELADAAGVSVRTFNRWLSPHMAQLEKLGYKSKMIIFTPAITEFICRIFAIECPMMNTS